MHYPMSQQDQVNQDKPETQSEIQVKSSTQILTYLRENLIPELQRVLNRLITESIIFLADL